MSIFDRFRLAPKKPDLLAPKATAAAPGSVANAPVGERRNGRRHNARPGTRVLIIDDSATVVAALRKMLRSAGYTTLEAGDAEQGLALIAREPLDLLFLDIVLPGMNGFGALRVIRRDPATQAMPVIMISGNEQAAEQFYGNRIGADDFMKKPFSRMEVFARIEALLDAEDIPRRKNVPGVATASTAAPARPMAGAPGAPAFAPTPAAAALAARTPAKADANGFGDNVPAELISIDAKAWGSGEPSAGSVRAQWTALDARKELTAMGLKYFSQAEFFAAIRRGDLLAVELFVSSTGVNVTQPFEGLTAVALAQQLGSTPIVRFLQSRLGS